MQIITIWHILCVILKSQPRSIPRKSSLNLLTKTHPKHRIQTTMPPSKTYPETPIHNNYTTQSPQTNVDINPQNHPSRYAATTLEETQHAQKSNTKYLFGKPLQRSQTWPEKYHLINTLTSVYLSNMFQSMETTRKKRCKRNKTSNRIPLVFPYPNFLVPFQRISSYSILWDGELRAAISTQGPGDENPPRLGSSNRWISGKPFGN